MKVVAFSDIHGYLPNDIPECDVVCIAGDICPLDIQDDLVKCISWFILEFRPWADKLPCKKVLFTPGNHDLFLDKIYHQCYNAKEMMKKLLGRHVSETKLVCLVDNSYEFEGKRFYGSPWIADLYRWGFYKPDDELETIWNNIPKQCDVLITHMPPRYGDAGTVLQRGWNHLNNYGSYILAELVNMRNIKYHIFGHVHSGDHSGNLECGGTRLVNVSLKDESYQPIYYPYEFEL